MTEINHAAIVATLDAGAIELACHTGLNSQQLQTAMSLAVVAHAAAMAKPGMRREAIAELGNTLVGWSQSMSDDLLDGFVENYEMVAKGMGITISPKPGEEAEVVAAAEATADE